LPVLDQALSGQEWLVDKLSLADFAVASTFRLREPAGISLSNLPHIDHWLTRVEALPSWQKSLPKV
jgi:glutathione S-transferase